MSSSLMELSTQLEGLIAEASQCVVTVYGQLRHTASGLLWQSDIVVTTSHSLERDIDLHVTLSDGITVNAQLVGRDPSTDLAVLKVDSETISPAVLGDPGQLAVGHLVVGLGRSGETGVNASLGIISTLGSSWQTRRGGFIDQFIQTDLTLQPNYSGGPLLNLQGEVMGINNWNRRRELTIPVTTVKRVVDQILDKGQINQGYLGIGMQSVQIQTALRSKLSLTAEKGVLIISLDSEGPAEAAGVLIGDIWIRFDGIPVGGSYDVLPLLTSERIGQPVTVDCIRAGTLISLTLTVAERVQPH